MTQSQRRPADPFRVHGLRIAIQTMKYSCLGARVMGGMNHPQAVDFLRAQGRKAGLPDDCSCRRD
jgi:hypothetical protein